MSQEASQNLMQSMLAKLNKALIKIKKKDMPSCPQSK